MSKGISTIGKLSFIAVAIFVSAIAAEELDWRHWEKFYFSENGN